MKVCIKTLGCKVNNYESEYMADLFKRKGFHFVEEKADIYVVNTCTVTNNSDKKSKKLIRSIRKNEPNSIIIAVGCFCQNLKERVSDIIDADIILGNKDKSKVVEYLEKYLLNKEKTIKFYDMSQVSFEDMEIKEYSSKTRAFVKIEDGCNNFCSYCIIPYVRGRVRSKNKDKVLEEIRNLVNNGHKEIVLTGIHTGQYGNEDYNFSNLLSDIVKIENLMRLRISSIEITELNSEVLEVLKNSKILVDHLHIPLQSGSERILKEMNRKYDKKYFLDKINEIRRIRPFISISTDVIVGFPSETEEEFNECYLFCKKIGFSKIHVFPYSDRDGTVASKINNKVSEVEKKKRVKKLMELSKELEKQYANKFILKKLDVLFEEEKDGYFIGHSGNYIKLKFKGQYELHKIYEVLVNKENIVE